MNKFIKRLLFILTLSTLGGGIGYYYTHQSSSIGRQAGPFYEYNNARDRADVETFFAHGSEDRWWLLWDPTEYYDLDLLLLGRAPNENPLYYGTLQVKVLRENDQLVGFTTYYKQTPTVGRILFVAVKPEFRGRGYAKKIVEFDIAELKKMGAQKVVLFTRTQNVRAQSLYTKLGFYETSRVEGGINYEKVI
ncbi:MAG: GNAT family N-acetyltransferase [Candidatus Babeliales bacterium]|nr:GNAT family N-acetyltransferase [Candidatus Babeliales bacterium]